MRNQRFCYEKSLSPIFTWIRNVLMTRFSGRPRTLRPSLRGLKSASMLIFPEQSTHHRRRISRWKSNEIDYFRSQNPATGFCAVISNYPKEQRGCARTHWESCTAPLFLAKTRMKTGNHWNNEESLDCGRSIRRWRDAVLSGQINMDVDLRPEATDNKRLASKERSDAWSLVE